MLQANVNQMNDKLCLVFGMSETLIDSLMLFSLIYKAEVICSYIFLINFNYIFIFISFLKMLSLILFFPHLFLSVFDIRKSFYFSSTFKEIKVA